MKINGLKRPVYEGRLKSFEPQHEDGVTRQNHFSTIKSIRKFRPFSGE